MTLEKVTQIYIIHTHTHTHTHTDKYIYMSSMIVIAGLDARKFNALSDPSYLQNLKVRLAQSLYLVD